MARGTIATTTANRTTGQAITETAGDATNGHATTNDGRVLVRFHNSGTTSRTVTISALIDGSTVPLKTYTLASGVSRLCGPYPVQVYGRSLLIDVSHAEVLITAEHP